MGLCYDEPYDIMLFVLAAFATATLQAEFLKIELSYAGAECASCMQFIRTRLAKNAGVDGVDFDKAGGRLVVRLKPGNAVKFHQIRDLVQQSGFAVKQAQVAVRGIVKMDRGIASLRIPEPDQTIRLRDPDTLLREYVTRKVEIEGILEQVLSQGARIDIIEVRRAKLVP